MTDHVVGHQIVVSEDETLVRWQDGFFLQEFVFIHLVAERSSKTGNP